MTNDAQQADSAATPQAGDVDPMFFDCVNAFVGLANQQASEHGLKRISLSTVYSAARFNAFAFLNTVDDPATDRDAFIAYMADMYRQMLGDNVDELIASRTSTHDGVDPQA